MRMKTLFYFALVIAFVIFFQKDPLYAFIVVVILVGVYLYYRKRKGSQGHFRRGIFGSSQMPYYNNSDKLINLFLMQQLFKNSKETKSQNLASTSSIDAETQKLEDTKNEVLELLKGE